MRKLYIIFVLVLFFGGFIFSAARMERLMADGTEILLPLAPVDPRALLLGDYMALDYEVNAAIAKAVREKPFGAEQLAGNPTLSGRSASGKVVLRLSDPGGSPLPPVGRFVRFDDDAPLGEREVRLGYKIRGQRIVTAASTYYFQEGHANTYEKARYGKIRLGMDGKSLLIGLCDHQGNNITSNAKVTE